MARTPNRHESIAAYAVSQPLFDALRAATASIEKQAIHLTAARDLIQQLHVKAPHANGPQDVDKYDRFLDSTARAWKSAAEVYNNIFEALVNVTAADATEGRVAAKEHDSFIAMAETAKGAKDVVQLYVRSHTSQHSVADGDGEGSDEHPSEESVKFKSGKTAKSVSLPHVSTPIRESSSRNGEDITLKHRPWKMPRMAVPKPASREQTQNLQDEQTAHSNINIHEQADTTRQVDFEDVSAEVAARLKAKEDQKKARAKEKKRKRESGDSFLDALNGNVNAESTKAEKPKKKKAKSDNTGVAGIKANFKRKKDEMLGAAPLSKKRKKTKT